MIILVRATLLIVGLVVCPALAWADGGTLRISERVGDMQLSAFTSPAALRVGPVDVSVLVQEAVSGNVLENVPVIVELECIDQPAVPLSQHATAASAANKLFQAAVFEVPKAGRWRATIKVGENQAAILQVNVEVGPPLPAWLELAPWTAWPFFVIVLFLVHQHRKTGAIQRGARMSAKVPVIAANSI